MVVTTSGSSGDSLVTTAAAPPFLPCPSTSGSISVDDVVNPIWSSAGEAVLAFYIGVISSTSNTWNSCGNLSFVSGAMLPWWRWKMMFCLCWSSGGKRVESSSAFRRKLERFWRRWGMLAAKATRLGWSSVLRNAFSLAFRIKRLLQVR